MTPHVAVPGARLSSLLARGVWGMAWRYAVLATAVVVRSSTHGVPLILLPEFVGVAGVGLVIGLWHSRSRFAAIWRAVTLGAIVAYLAPAVPAIYPYAIVVAFALATLEPCLSALMWRPGTDGGLPAYEFVHHPAAGAPPGGPPASSAAPGAAPSLSAATYSPDGRSLWDGVRWVLVAPAPARRRRARRILAAGVLLAAAAVGTGEVYAHPNLVTQARHTLDQAVSRIAAR